MTKVYTTKTCAYCPTVKRYLDMKDHTYTVIDVTDDVSLIKEVADKSGVFTTPQVLFDDGTYVVGLNYGRLNQSIANN